MAAMIGIVDRLCALPLLAVGRGGRVLRIHIEFDSVWLLERLSLFSQGRCSYLQQTFRCSRKSRPMKLQRRSRGQSGQFFISTLGGRRGSGTNRRCSCLRFSAAAEADSPRGVYRNLGACWRWGGHWGGNWEQTGVILSFESRAMAAWCHRRALFARRTSVALEAAIVDRFGDWRGVIGCVVELLDDVVSVVCDQPVRGS